LKILIEGEPGMGQFWFFKLAVDGIAIRRMSVSTAGGIAAHRIPDCLTY
jgi:hypothetical protein